MTGHVTYALANEHINDLHRGAENARRVTKGPRRASRRPVLGGARRLRRAFG